MNNELHIPKDVDIVNFLAGVPSGTITGLYVYETPKDLMYIQSLLRVLGDNSVLHLIKE